MKVKDIMSKKFITVDIEAQLKKVLTTLLSEQIDFVIVTNNYNKKSLEVKSYIIILVTVC